MFNLYEPTVKATIAFLRLHKVSVNDFTVNETLQSHPDWPSLLCISDALNKWNVPNAAAKCDMEHIDGIPLPFLIYTGRRDAPFSIVTQVTADTVELLDKNFKKPVIHTKEEFGKQWNGVYLIAEAAENAGEKDFAAVKRKRLLQLMIPVGLICSLLLVLFGSFFLLKGFTESIALSQFMFLLLFVAGLVVSVTLLWYEIDKLNPLLHKVCTGIKKGNCNAILSGKQSKVFSWLSWSEVGFFYFTGGILTFFLSQFSKEALALVAVFNLAALTYPFYSIYYQWRIAKQWCVLCLSVQALLALGAVNIVAFQLWKLIPTLSIAFLAKAFVWYMVPVFLWYMIKPLILKLQQAQTTKREYLRIKFNSEIFETLLKKQKQVHLLPEGLGIVIGKTDATNELIKVCNPFCGPCATAHPKIEALLEELPNLKARIIFTTPNKEEHPAIKATRHLLAIAEQGNEVKTKQALDDWYSAEKKNYDHFAEKYTMNGELQKQGKKIEAMYEWCEEMKISYTPTIFINGYEIPEVYNIDDLKYFLLE